MKEYKKTIFFSLFGLVCLGIIYMFIPESNNESFGNNKFVDLLDDKELEKPFNDLLENGKSQNKTMDSTEIDDKYLEVSQKLKEFNASKNPSNIYNSENDSVIKSYQKEITNNTDYKNYAPKKKRLTYAEELEKERQQYASPKPVNDKANKKKISFVGAVYKTQKLLPGQRINLVTKEEFIYKNKRFKKGFRFNGFIRIEEYRVLFEINSISKIPINVEVRDTDNEIGIYSEKAIDLWNLYTEEMSKETTSTVVGDVAESLPIPILSNSVSSLAQFFNSKRAKKAKPLTIRNDTQLFITILN